MPEESWVVSGPQVIDVDEVRSLRVQLVGGRVDVVTHDEPGARIEVHDVDGRPLEVSLSGGELRVGYQFTLDGWGASWRSSGTSATRTGPTSASPCPATSPPRWAR